jgi:y4mF family transcriptional regulator
MTTSQHIGSIVRFHRKQAGLTQIKLAALGEVGKSAVFDIEKGKSTVQLDTLLRVLSALNISIELDSPLMPAWRQIQAPED